MSDLGPLARLAGTWEGNQGVDVSPVGDGSVETQYREVIQFDPMGPVKNGSQVLFGLKYSTTVWPLGESDPFHEELGYWLWDGDAKQVMRCFIVPRGVLVNAGGQVDERASQFRLTAEVGSDTYGVLSNPVLDKTFKTVFYELEVNLLDDSNFSYKEDTHLKIINIQDVFHHTDQNTLIRK